MIRPPLRRRPEWDVLEARLCPSDAVASAIVPVERTDATAVARHDDDLQQVASGRDSVVFLGDSITDWWANGAGAAVWSERMAGLNAADFGVAGDLAENLLWRVENGELAGAPKAAVVEIGTNNLGDGESVDYTTSAIEAVVSEIKALSPTTQVLLMGILPRGASSTDPLRLEAAQVNAQLSAWAPAQGVGFLDIGGELTSPDGTLTADFLPGDLHPNAQGYEVWADAVEGIIGETLGIPSPFADATPVPPPSAMSTPAPAASSPSTPSMSPTPAVANTEASPPAQAVPASLAASTTDLTTADRTSSSAPPAEAAPAVVVAEVADAPVALARVAQPTTGEPDDPFADPFAGDESESV